jgi:Uma2 family endonuclease
MTREEFESARGREGHRYELIGGKVYVSPVPNLPHDRISEWVERLLYLYQLAHPDVMNYVSPRARIFVPGQEESTNPEPDLACYRGFPRNLSFSDVNWQDVSPILVVEIVSDDDPEKDLERNVDLYEQAPSIREYWVLDPRRDPDRPTLRVYRRRSARWQRPIDVAPGEIYTTKLLPGFALVLDPHAEGSQP